MCNLTPTGMYLRYVHVLHFYNFTTYYQTHLPPNSTHPKSHSPLASCSASTEDSEAVLARSLSRFSMSSGPRAVRTFCIHWASRESGDEDGNTLVKKEHNGLGPIQINITPMYSTAIPMLLGRPTLWTGVGRSSHTLGATGLGTILVGRGLGVV